MTIAEYVAAFKGAAALALNTADGRDIYAEWTAAKTRSDEMWRSLNENDDAFEFCHLLAACRKADANATMALRRWNACVGEFMAKAAP